VNNVVNDQCGQEHGRHRLEDRGVEHGASDGGGARIARVRLKASHDDLIQGGEGRIFYT